MLVECVHQAGEVQQGTAKPIVCPFDWKSLSQTGSCVQTIEAVRETRKLQDGQEKTPGPPTGGAPVAFQGFFIKPTSSRYALQHREILYAVLHKSVAVPVRKSEMAICLIVVR